jgi:hypothetical protein
MTVTKRSSTKPTIQPDPEPPIQPTNIQDILNARESTYGKFSSHAEITQRLKAEMRETPNWEQLTHSQREALEMVAHKIGRILNGNPNYVDSWVDIAGYTQLVIAELNDAQ